MVHRRHTRFGLARRQVGATLLGYIILVSFIGVFAFGAIRLTPVYLNYMKVVGVVNGVFEEFDGQRPTRARRWRLPTRQRCRPTQKPCPRPRI